MPLCRSEPWTAKPESAWGSPPSQVLSVLCVSILKEMTASVKLWAEILPGAPSCSHPASS